MFHKTIKNGLNYVIDEETGETFISLTSVQTAFFNKITNVYVSNKNINLIDEYIKNIVKDLDLGFIYFLQNSITKDIKIGKSKNLYKRLNNLQTCNASKLQLIHVISTIGISKVEKNYHNLFQNNRLNGEWFKKDILKNNKQKSIYINAIDKSLDIISIDFREWYSVILETGDDQEIKQALEVKSIVDKVYKQCLEKIKETNIQDIINLYT